MEEKSNKLYVLYTSIFKVVEKNYKIVGIFDKEHKQDAFKEMYNRNNKIPYMNNHIEVFELNKKINIENE